MAINIEMDIADAYITQSAFSVVDLVSALNAGNLTVSNIWFPPNTSAVTVKPVQLTPAWPSSTAGKSGASGYNFNTTKYEAIQKRATADYFLSSIGTADGSQIRTAGSFLHNQGICVEFECTAAAATTLTDYLVINFGQWFNLHVHTTGLCDFEDTRPSAASSPLIVKGANLTVGGQNLLGKFVQIIIVPLRRGYVYVWSNQGGAFEAPVGSRLDTSVPKGDWTTGEPGYHVTTEAAQVGITASTSARSIFAVTSLQYPLTASVAVPVTSTPTPVTAPPTNQQVEAETQDGTTAVLTILDQNGNAFNPTGDNPATGIQYSIALTSPSVNLAPVIFHVLIDFDRQLSNRTYDTNVIGSPQEFEWEWSRDQAAATCWFILDNPNNVWTSLKDLYNRKVTVSIVADDIDPTSMIIFVGYTGPSEYVDGNQSKIKIPCTGLRKKLQMQLLNDSEAYDGQNHAQVVKKILMQGGVDEDDIIIYDDGVPLDTADQGKEKLWRPTNKTTRDAFLQHIADTFSGWVYTDLGGTFYYVPQDFFTAAGIANNGSVTQVLVETPVDGSTGQYQTFNRTPNPTTITAMNLQQTSEEPRANDIFVFGLSDDDPAQIVCGRYTNQDSISNRSATNYVGDRWMFVYCSGSITTADQAARVAGIFGQVLPFATTRVTFSLLDFQFTLLPYEGAIYMDGGWGIALIVGISMQTTCDRVRNTQYTAQLVS